MRKLFAERQPADEVIEGKLKYLKIGSKRALYNEILNLVLPESCLDDFEQIEDHIDSAYDELNEIPEDRKMMKKKLRLKRAREIATCINSMRSSCRFCLNKKCERRDMNFPVDEVKERAKKHRNRRRKS